jgi:hypothetical protein
VSHPNGCVAFPVDWAFLRKDFARLRSLVMRAFELKEG